MPLRVKAALRHVRRWLQGVLLRRTKHSSINGEPILDLPKCEQTLRRVDFSAEERALYDRIKEETKTVMAGLGAGGGCARSPVHVTAALTRCIQGRCVCCALRLQCCALR